MKPRSKLILVIVTIFLLSIAGCGKLQPYTTSSIKTELLKLKTQKLCVVSFSSDPDVLVTGGSVLTGLLRAASENKEWEKSLSDKLNKSYFENLISHFQKKFTLIKADYESAKHQITITDRTKIVDAIAEADAEIGLVVNSHFGWSWNPGEAGIGDYNIATHVSLVNKKGDLIWDFDSRATVFPSQSVEGLLSAVTATTPSVDKILADYAEFFQYYPLAVVGLISEDIVGKQHGSRFDDYVAKEKLKSKILLYGK